MNNHVLEDHVLTAEEASTAASPSPPDTSVQSVNFSETTINNGTGTDTILPERSVSTGQTNIFISAKTSETALLDERSLLACIVRTIPTGGRIRISSTVSWPANNFSLVNLATMALSCAQMGFDLFLSIAATK